MSAITRSIRFDADLWTHLQQRALLHHRSFNAEVIYLLRRALKETEYYDREALRIVQTAHEHRRD
jgi:plasmid stability protein